MPSINWSTKVISIPRSELVSLGNNLYELDINDFRLALKDIEDGEEGSVFPDTHRHNTEVTLSGVTYARTFEIINGYTVSFEDVGSPYIVTCIGGNHNLADVKVLNQVSLIVGNSAGLIVKSVGSGLSSEEQSMLRELFEMHGLDATKPLTVTSTNRSVGDITQNINESSGTVTVHRV